MNVKAKLKAGNKTTTGDTHMKTLRTLGMSGLAVCGATLAVYAQTASAANYTASGQYDMRGFVSNSTPLFGCSSTSGNITWTPVTVRAPSNIGAQVYVTNYLSSAVPGSQFVRYDMGPNASPNPKGVSLTPGQSFHLNPMYLQTPNGLFYYASVRIDFYYPKPSPQMMGTVFITPNTLADWAATWNPYYGNGYTYCYK